jgi:alkanesulfonate monooxygenase SsuD/methylene tetrahydromethanopterin reductase-like flavin-dependent oxidoreductase (luciferase family)
MFAINFHRRAKRGARSRKHRRTMLTINIFVATREKNARVFARNAAWPGIRRQ